MPTPAAMGTSPASASSLCVFSLGERAVGSRPPSSPEWVCVLRVVIHARSLGVSSCRLRLCRGGGGGSHCLAFLGVSLVEGCAVTKKPGWDQATHQPCGGLGALRPRPVLLLPLDLHSRTPTLPSLGSPIPSWGTPTPDSHRSANASETDFLQRCVEGNGKGRVLRCLDRSLGGRPRCGEAQGKWHLC